MRCDHRRAEEGLEAHLRVLPLALLDALDPALDALLVELLLLAQVLEQPRLVGVGPLELALGRRRVGDLRLEEELARLGVPERSGVCGVRELRAELRRIAPGSAR